MFNKELLMMVGGDSDATVVLRITHKTGDDSTVDMQIRYLDPPYTSYPLLPPIPLRDTVEYTVKVPKGMRIQVIGGSNDLQGTQATPSNAIEKIDDYSYKDSAFRVLDNCVVEGYVTTYY